jgi:hypothetical protein
MKLRVTGGDEPTEATGRGKAIGAIGGRRANTQSREYAAKESKTGTSRNIAARCRDSQAARACEKQAYLQGPDDSRRALGAA